MEFTRTPLETWAWTREDEIVGGTVFQNPKSAMEAGLELVEAGLEDGTLDAEEAREIVEDARETVLAGSPGDAHRSAAEAAADALEAIEAAGPVGSAEGS